MKTHYMSTRSKRATTTVIVRTEVWEVLNNIRCDSDDETTCNDTSTVLTGRLVYCPDRALVRSRLQPYESEEADDSFVTIDA